MRTIWRTAAVAFALFAGACASLPPAPPVPTDVAAPADFPQNHYLNAATQGEAVYRIVPADSLAVIYAYRTRLGHNHVVASHTVSGFAQLTRDGSIGQADIYIALDTLAVDDASLRAEAGFDTQPSESDIAGTRHNLLTKVLETEKFPYTTLHVERVEHEQDAVAPAAVLVATLTLHGVTQTLRIPAELEFSEAELRVSGKFSLRQTDFGITPFSVLGGLFQMKDEIDLRFILHASRLR